MEAAIRVEGLAEFGRALRQVDAQLPRLVRIACNSAAQVVVDYGQSHIVKRTGRAASTIKARSTRTSVRVVEGGPRAPYTPWLDFGGTVGRGRVAAVATGRGHRRTADQQARAGSVKRTFYREGRYLYPALREKKAEIQQALESALTDVATQAGLDLA